MASNSNNAAFASIMKLEDLAPELLYQVLAELTFPAWVALHGTSRHFRSLVNGSAKTHPARYRLVRFWQSLPAAVRHQWDWSATSPSQPAADKLKLATLLDRIASDEAVSAGECWGPADMRVFLAEWPRKITEEAKGSSWEPCNFQGFRFSLFAFPPDPGSFVGKITVGNAVFCRLHSRGIWKESKLYNVLWELNYPLMIDEKSIVFEIPCEPTYWEEFLLMAAEPCFYCAWAGPRAQKLKALP